MRDAVMKKSVICDQGRDLLLTYIGIIIKTVISDNNYQLIGVTATRN